MSDRTSLLEELQELIHKLFQFPPRWGLVTDKDEAETIGRIGTIKRRLAKDEYD